MRTAGELKAERDALWKVFRDAPTSVDRVYITSALDTLAWVLGEPGILSPSRLNEPKRALADGGTDGR